MAHDITHRNQRHKKFSNPGIDQVRAGHLIMNLMHLRHIVGDNESESSDDERVRQFTSNECPMQ